VTTITITPAGQIRYLGGSAPDLETEGRVTKRRLSHIEPCRLPLRFVFRVLRYLFHDTSAVAAWTRRWGCLWRVNIIGGPTWGRYGRRQSAIDAERDWLEQHGY
jgi:hypothetical protein